MHNWCDMAVLYLGVIKLEKEIRAIPECTKRDRGLRKQN